MRAVTIKREVSWGTLLGLAVQLGMVLVLAGFFWQEFRTVVADVQQSKRERAEIVSTLSSVHISVMNAVREVRDQNATAVASVRAELTVRDIQQARLEEKLKSLDDGIKRIEVKIDRIDQRDYNNRTFPGGMDQ